MNNKEILVEAFKRGRAWDVSKPNLLNLDLAAVEKMTGEESDAKLLIQSLQESDANYTATVDGDIGPKTQELVGLDRCPIPDFAPPPGAAFHYDDPELQRVVETMQANAIGSGSWPSCDPDKPGVNSFRVRINPAGMPQTIKDYHVKALEAVVASYAEMGCALRYIIAAEGDCEISKIIKNLAGSTIGMNEFPEPNTCNQTINGWLDPGYAPSDYRMWANLECHETGHGVGLQHTRGHIMNPSILLVWPLSFIGGPSEATMRRYFGGVPLPTGPTPTSPNPPINGTIFGEKNTQGGISLRGTLELVLPGAKYLYTVEPADVLGQYKLVKKIEL